MFNIKNIIVPTDLSKLSASAFGYAKDLAERMNAVIHLIYVLEKTPPELASDIIDKGIVLSGGTALLKNLDKHITHFTGVPVHISDEPLLCVVKGLAKALENFDIFSKSMIKR